MKITDIQTLCLSRMHEPENQWFVANVRVLKADCAIVIIHTDEDITGIGEACAYGVPSLIKSWVDFLAPTLIGRDLLDSTTAPSPHYRSSAYDCAVAGIDCALWDIRGKAAGKRVCDLLVGATDSRNVSPIPFPVAGTGTGITGLFRGVAPTTVRLYASSGCRYDWGADTRQLIEEALGYIEQGYTAMKLRIGTEWSWHGVTVDRFLGLMRELTEAVRDALRPSTNAQDAQGAKFALALDGNQRLTEAQAMPIAKELERLGFAWFEEPIPQKDVDGYARIAASVEMPITGGEQFTTLEQFRPYFEKRAYDIVQPDAGWCGLSEAMRIAQCAERFGVRVMPHNWHNGLMTMANAHFVAALPHPYMCELCMIQGPLQWAIVKGKPLIKDGYLHLPDKPGLGVELADDLEAQFPYIPGSWATPVQGVDVAR